MTKNVLLMKALRALLLVCKQTNKISGYKTIKGVGISWFITYPKRRCDKCGKVKKTRSY